jgi:HEPN superfamily protein
MYQTALICRIKPDDFDEFERLEKATQKPPRMSLTEYKGCSYSLEDIHHYRLMMTLFVETFAATGFSLLDVCGYLLNNLFDLGRTPDDANFRKAYRDLQLRKQNDPDAVFNLLSNYILDNASPVPWLRPLKGIRNRTTHRLITDVCDVQTIYRRGLHDEVHVQTTEFVLNRDLFPANAPDKKLRDFAQEVFEGMQEFVEDLYDYLKQAVIAAGSLPLS